jgi:hypothetical protein
MVRIGQMPPSAAERRNGWDADSLTAYLKSRDIAAARIINNDPGARAPRRPASVNRGKYRKLDHWKRR